MELQKSALSMSESYDLLYIKQCTPNVPDAQYSSSHLTGETVSCIALTSTVLGLKGVLFMSHWDAGSSEPNLWLSYS